MEGIKSHLLIGSSMAGPTLDGCVVTGVEIEGSARPFVDENIALTRFNRHDCLSDFHSLISALYLPGDIR